MDAAPGLPESSTAGFGEARGSYQCEPGSTSARSLTLGPEEAGAAVRVAAAPRAPQASPARGLLFLQVDKAPCTCQPSGAAPALGRPVQGVQALQGPAGGGVLTARAPPASFQAAAES